MTQMLTAGGVCCSSAPYILISFLTLIFNLIHYIYVIVLFSLAAN